MGELLTYRRVTEEEKLSVVAAMSLGFGMPGQAESRAEQTPSEQLRVVEDDGQFAGVLRVSTTPQYWLGQQAPSAQVLALAISLEQRARPRPGAAQGPVWRAARGRHRDRHPPAEHGALLPRRRL